MVYDIVICRTVYKEEVSPPREILGEKPRRIGYG